MKDVIDHQLESWVGRRTGRKALVSVFNRIRDIPYRVLPELHHPQHYQRILRVMAGSCTPKHLLLAEMFQRLGWDVLLVVFPYRWDAFEELYPPELKKMARLMPPVNHLACKVLIEGRYILVDATIDPSLGRLGLPVNDCWDGISETVLPVHPTGEVEVYHPLEAQLMPPPVVDDSAQAFYDGLNAFFDRVRNST